MAHQAAVLLVSESLATRSLVSGCLERFEADLLIAGDAAEARRVADSGLKVALIDARLPDGGGYSLGKYLKKRAPQIVIVILLSEADPQPPASAFFSVLRQPWSRGDLISFFSSRLSRRSRTPTSAEPSREADDEAMSPSERVAPEAEAPLPAEESFEESLVAPAEPPPRYHATFRSAGAPLESALGAAPRTSAAPTAVPAMAPPPTAADAVRLESSGADLPSVKPQDAVPRNGESGESAGTGGDDIVCSAFCPPAPLLGDEFLVQVFAHPPGGDSDAAKAAREVDVDAVRHGSKRLRLPVPRGTVLHISISAPGLDVTNPVEELVWMGGAEGVQFVLKVPWACAAQRVLVTVTIGRGAIPLGTLRFQLSIARGTARDEGRLIPKPAEAVVTRFAKAFASYASADRAEVLRRTQMVAMLGIECFQDVLSLEPGERWQKTLYTRIDECDLFLLFWSHSARASEWVLKEARYALARQNGDAQGPPTIRPVVLEGPPVPSPPEDLGHLHFNDAMQYAIYVEDMLRTKRLGG